MSSVITLTHVQKTEPERIHVSEKFTVPIKRGWKMQLKIEKNPSDVASLHNIIHFFFLLNFLLQSTINTYVTFNLQGHAIFIISPFVKYIMRFMIPILQGFFLLFSSFHRTSIQYLDFLFYSYGKFEFFLYLFNYKCSLLSSFNLIIDRFNKCLT